MRDVTSTGDARSCARGVAHSASSLREAASASWLSHSAGALSLELVERLDRCARARRSKSSMYAESLAHFDGDETLTRGDLDVEAGDAENSSGPPGDI